MFITMKVNQVKKCALVSETDSDKTKHWAMHKTYSNFEAHSVVTWRFDGVGRGFDVGWLVEEGEYARTRAKEKYVNLAGTASTAARNNYRRSRETCNNVVWSLQDITLFTKFCTNLSLFGIFEFPDSLEMFTFDITRSTERRHPLKSTMQGFFIASNVGRDAASTLLLRTLARETRFRMNDRTHLLRVSLVPTGLAGNNRLGYLHCLIWQLTSFSFIRGVSACTETGHTLKFSLWCY